MTIVKIKALKDILSPKGFVIIKAGVEAEVLKESADKWVKEGLAETFKSNRKPIDLKKLITEQKTK